MLRALSHLFVVIFGFLLATPLLATDVYLIQARARGGVIDGCQVSQWWTDVILHNEGPEEKLVQFLGVSNGGRPASTIQNPPGTQIKIPSKRTVSVNRSAGGAWWPIPVGLVPLWVLRLDVPAEVVVENTLYAGSLTTCHFPRDLPIYGATPLPVFRSLTPANKPRTILGTDLGELIPSRINVGIYNASPDRDAQARIEIRETCDDDLLEEKIVTIPADAIIQFGGFGGVPGSCPTFPITYVGSFYVVVTVNQPSLSYVANIANDREPSVGVAIRQ